MIITVVKIKKLCNSGTKLIGIADITLDDMIVLHDIKILDNSNKKFLAMPSRSSLNGFRDIYHPINSKTRDRIEAILFKLYEKTLDFNNDIFEFENVRDDKNSLIDQKGEDFEMMMRF